MTSQWRVMLNLAVPRSLAADRIFVENFAPAGTPDPKSAQVNHVYLRTVSTSIPNNSD